MRCTAERVSSLKTIRALLGLTLLGHSVAGAQTTYKVQPIVKFGDTVEDVVIKTTNGDFEIGALNDNGQLVFLAENKAGGEVLLQYAGGKLTPIVVGGRDAPGGKWPRSVAVYSPVNMNQSGNIAFAADIVVANKLTSGTFLWDVKAQKLTAVALKGMPAVNNLAFEGGGGYAPVINNSGEIAFPAAVKNAIGKAQHGVFLLGRDGKLLPIALPDQDLPGGGKVLGAGWPSINEAGMVALLVAREGETDWSSYLWEVGTLRPLAVIGMDAPGGGKFTVAWDAWVNNKNQNVLVDAAVGSSRGLYLFVEGKFLPVAVPGQQMPDGGKLKEIRYRVSFPNEAGQHAFVATLEDKTTAAYLMDADGKLSLILKSGTQTELGTITGVGRGAGRSFGIGLNSKGQVALTVNIAGGPDTIVLLTPTAP
jgi:hypothetical protein